MMGRGRILLLAALLLLPLGGLEARLIYLQLLKRQDYVGDLVTRKRTIELAPAARGRILDRRGNVLAEDVRAFDLHVVLDEFEKDPDALETLAVTSGRTAEQLREGIEAIYQKIERLMNARPERERLRVYARERRAPYLLVRNVDFEAAIAIETNPDRFPGVIVREGLKRVYPYGPIGCHIVGCIGKVNADAKEYERLAAGGYFTEGFEEVIGEEGVGYLLRRGVFMDETIGRGGVGRSYNALLRGKPGLLLYERETGKSRQVLELVPSVPGTDIELTIDIELQKFVEEEIAKARSHHGDPTEAAAVVLDPQTGEVLALASNRAFDPNDFVPPGKKQAVEEYFRKEGSRPLTSRAFQSQYQLGSIFKVVTATAGLEMKLITPGTVTECRGKYRENLRHFNCHIWNNFQSTHGPLNLYEAMERSCNIYFYTIGEQAGMDGLAYWAEQYGYGSKTGLDLPSEAGGILPRRQQYPLDALSLAIGQHELMVSPLQVARMMAIVANGGRRVVPHVRRGNAGGEPTLIAPQTLVELRQALKDVVHGDHGTAKTFRNFDAAGKTSSAQNRTDLPSHAWFAGYAPVESPRFAFAVLVAYGGHGGDNAAPHAFTIVNKLLGNE